MAFADTGEMLAYAANSFDLVDLFANSSPDYVGQLETYRADATGEFGVGIASLYAEDRELLLPLIDEQRMQDKFDVCLAQFMQDIGVAAASTAEQRKELVIYMEANSASVKERALTFGSTSFSGTGNGTLYRLEVDENATEMQGWFADAYTVTCELDQRQLRRSHEEVFSFKGSGEHLDLLEPGGQGDLGTLVALNPASPSNLVKNGMFASATLSGSTITALGTWTITTGNTEADTTNTYWSDVRGVPAASLRSLKLTDNDTISQDLIVDAGGTFPAHTPYLCAVVVYRESSCDGTLTFTVGGSSKAQAMSGLSNGAWNVVVIDVDEDVWHAAINQNTLTCSVALSSRTTGTCSIAGVGVWPMTRIGGGGDPWTGAGCQGQYFAILAGSTAFVQGDNWTWTDTEGTRGETQYWWARAGYGYLPHSATPSIADK